MKKLSTISFLLVITFLFQSCCDWCTTEPDQDYCVDYPDYEGATEDFFLTINLSDSTRNKDILQTIFASPMVKDAKYGTFKGGMAIAAKLKATSQNDSMYYNINVSDVTVRRLFGTSYQVDALKFYAPEDTKSGTPILAIKMSVTTNAEDQVNSQKSIVIPELEKYGTLDVLTTTNDFPLKYDQAIFTKICQDKIN